MSGPPSTGAEDDGIEYPSPHINGDHIPDDLLDCTNAVHELVATADCVVRFFKWAISPTNAEIATAGLVSGFVETLDRSVTPCSELIWPVQLELIAHGDGYSEGNFHATSAHDAAIQYALQVRRRVDLIVRVATRRGGYSGERFLPAKVLEENWPAVVQTFKKTLFDHFDDLPTGERIRIAVGREAAKVARVRTFGRPAESAVTPLPRNEFEGLRALAHTLGLGGKEFHAVTAICDGNGRCPVADLAVRFEWGNPPDDWNGLKKRLNRKLKSRGWVFFTKNREACVRAAIGRK